jgi:hypothetical protein
VVLVVEAILQTHVDVLADRRADTRESLPGEAGVQIDNVDRGRAGHGRDHRVLDAANANTAADEALQAVIGTEVEQAVGHEAQRAGATTQLGVVVVLGRAAIALFLGATIAGFGFEAERTEVVADDAASRSRPWCPACRRCSCR